MIKKRRITTYLDEDVLQILKQKSKVDPQGRGYQTLLNESLRKSLVGTHSNYSQQKIKTLEKRLSALESLVQSQAKSGDKQRPGFRLFDQIEDSISAITEDISSRLNKEDK